MRKGTADRIVRMRKGIVDRARPKRDDRDRVLDRPVRRDRRVRRGPVGVHGDDRGERARLAHDELERERLRRVAVAQRELGHVDRDPRVAVLRDACAGRLGREGEPRPVGDGLEREHTCWRL